MPYLALDDNFAQNPKVAGLSDRAFRLHVIALCYCSAHLTDGFVPVSAKLWGELGSNIRQSEHLVRAGLWAKVEGGFQIHDYLEWNASAAQVKEKRRKERLRKRAASFDASARNPRGNVNDFRADSGGSAPREPSKEGSLSRELAKNARARTTKPAAATANPKQLERALNFIRNTAHEYTPISYQEEIARFNLNPQDRHTADELYTTLTETTAITTSAPNGTPDLFLDTEPDPDDSA